MSINPNQELNIVNPVAVLDLASADIEGAITTASSFYSISMYRKFAFNNIATTDSLIETATIGTDGSGAFLTNWLPTSLYVKLAGTRYSYYPKVYNDTETYYGSNITVLDKDTVLINEVEYALGDIQNIPVYDELSKDSINNDYTSFTYTYQNWREDFPVLTIVDGVITTPASVIYSEGKVNLNTATDGTNEIYTSYTFRFFSSRQINSFIERTIQDINMISPTTDYGRDSYPPYWEDTIVIGAALRALDALFVSVIFREKLLIFANPDIISSINSYYSRISAAYDMAKTKIKKMHDTTPLGVTGFDTLAPPRVMGSAFRDYIYLKGKAF